MKMKEAYSSKKLEISHTIIILDSINYQTYFINTAFQALLCTDLQSKCLYKILCNSLQFTDKTGRQDVNFVEYFLFKHSQVSLQHPIYLPEQTKFNITAT